MSVNTGSNPAHSDPADSDRVIIFDTTLRDGEQSPGASMNLDEKLRIAELLEEMGVDVIEAGFPIASNGDFEAVNEIAKRAKNSTICGLARSAKGDIERAAEALKPAVRPRIHTFIATSPLHMKFKLQMEPDEVYQQVVDSVSYARNFTDDVDWSPEDGTGLSMIFCAAASRLRSRPERPVSTCRIRSATRCPRNSAILSGC